MTVLNDHINHHKHVQSLYEELLKDVAGVHIHKQPTDPRYDANFWLCAATLDADVKIQGQKNAYKEVIKAAVDGAAGPYVTDDDVRYIVDGINITPVEQCDVDILANFAKSILDGTKSLDDDIPKLVDENFWDLV